MYHANSWGNIETHVSEFWFHEDQAARFTEPVIPSGISAFIIVTRCQTCGNACDTWERLCICGKTTSSITVRAHA